MAEQGYYCLSLRKAKGNQQLHNAAGISYKAVFFFVLNHQYHYKGEIMRKSRLLCLAALSPAREPSPAVYQWAGLLLLIVFGGTACSGLPAGNSASTTPVPSAGAVAPQTNVTDASKNPLPDLSAAATAGKSLYQANCAFCHGDTGAGDGLAGPSFEPKPTDLRQGGVTTDSDGKLFLALKNGKGKMPGMKKLTAEELWQVVAYTRTLAKK